jgi:hypothetical protein
MYHCPRCNINFGSSRALNGHGQYYPICYAAIMKGISDQISFSKNNTNINDNTITSIKATDVPVDWNKVSDDWNNDTLFDCTDSDIIMPAASRNNDSSDEELEEPPIFSNDKTANHGLIIKYKEYCKNGKTNVLMDINKYKSSVDLLNILQQSGAPLYLFDNIMSWASKSIHAHHYNFETFELPKRKDLIKLIKEQFDYQSLAPIIKEISLPGSEQKIDIVLHDFVSSLYTLLCDDQLMHISNLLIDENDVFKAPVKPTANSPIDDVNTGDVWFNAYSHYVDPANKELLCPIIFFIDKTHTDKNGRLCIEQVRFTLGIFKRSIRNQSRAWRAIGYIMDQGQISNVTRNKFSKVKDFQYMNEIILESYKKAQKNVIRWELNVNTNMNGTKEKVKVNLRIPTLFIIGDTAGHDAIVGKFGTRTSNVKRLCRYCNTPFNETDNPFHDYTLYKARVITKKIEEGKVGELQEMSMHCVRNAWSDVLFCDFQRGVFGATPAEIMHCLQSGLYEYIIKQLFHQKIIKKRKNKNTAGKKGKKQKSTSEDLSEESADSDGSADQDCPNWNDSIELSSSNVFTENYLKVIDKLLRKYGYYLMHQSDRSLPRTHFYTNYTSVGYKNASEMTGIFIVLLMVFATTEGDNLDNRLGKKRSAQYIRVFETMLMMEYFCKHNMHVRKDIKLLQRIMPIILNTVKNTIARTDGNQMKIIKFHLPLHFAEDMIRFGSMANYDSGIGELHHKNFAKKPAKNTQRRKNIFEYQTAIRQVENSAIQRAVDYIYPDHLNEDQIGIDSETSNRGYKIEFCLNNYHEFVYSKLKNKPKCQWVDVMLQQSLTKLLIDIINSKAIVPPLKFFTEHKRHDNLFRADPCFKPDTKQPRYDWVYINWGETNFNCVPAKLLMFMDITAEQLQSGFQFGGSFVNEAGSYAIIYSFQSNDKILAHLDSMLVDYGKLIRDKDNYNLILYAVSVDSIVKPCIAVPYNTENNIIDADEWLILHPKEQWYDIFLDFMRNEEMASKNKN